MAKKIVPTTAEEMAAMNKLLVEQAKLQASVSNSMEDYLAGLEKAKRLNQTILDNKKIEETLQKEFRDARARNDVKEAKMAIFKLKLLKQETTELEAQLEVLGASLKQVNKMNLVWSKIAANTLKGVSKLPGIFKDSYGKLKGYGLFEMDKAIKTSALQMGLLGKESKNYQDIIRNVAMDTNDIGIGVEKLAKMQAEYSETLGRNVMLGKEGLKSMAAMAAATGLGEEGTSKMAADMDNQGLSAERTADYINDTMNDSHKMGLNASKVVKNISGNMKMLNKYNFKGGIKGLAKMAETVSKLGVDMEAFAPVVDKLFDVEGAVNMSAQLQVMGGAWAKMSDPFHLMYMARNDMEGLADEISKAAASSVHFDEESKTFKMSSLEMQRLKKVAEELGMSYDELAKSAKNVAKFNKIKSQISFSVGGDKEGKAMQEFLTNSAELDEKGRAFIIDVKGDKQFLDQLGSTGRDVIKAKIAEKKSLEERAKAAQNFDDKLTNLINMVKTSMLPIIDGIDEVLGPLVDGLLKNPEFKDQLKKLGRDIAEFVKGGATIVKWLAEAAIWLGPKGTIATILGVKGLLSIASWVANGRALATGFNMGTGKGFGVNGGAIGPAQAPQSFGAGVKGRLGGGMAIGAGVLAAATTALSEYNENKDNGMGTGENVVRTGAKATGAGVGAWGGAALGAEAGLVAGPIGAAIGALIGGAIGAWGGSEAGEGLGNIIEGPKFHDFTSENGKTTAILSGGQINQIDKKDTLLGLKEGGPIANAMDNSSKESKSSNMNIQHSPLEIKGNITLTLPGGTTVDIDYLKEPQNIRTLSRMMNTEIQKAMGGGKLKS